MTDTINNVPRELLEEVMLAAQRMPVRGPSIRAKLHAILSAPSPAGVDGLACAAALLLPALRQYMHNDGTGLLAGYDLETTEAIIDGLRGELIEERAKVAQLEEGIPRIMEASYQFRQQRDQLAGFLLAASKASSAAEVGLIVDTALAELPQ